MNDNKKIKKPVKKSKLDNKKDRNIDIKFDINKHPKKQAFYLKPVAWLLSFPDIKKHKSKITYHNMDNVEHPYLLLCTHHAFIDFKVTTKAIFPHGGTYVVAIDGFIGREGIMRNVGCIGTRKFVSDTTLVKQLMYSIKKLKQTAIIYPEARYSICGTNAILPPSLGKLCKVLNVPVVVLNMHGHYINSSVWNLKEKGTPIEADITQIVKKEELATLSIQEINERINKAFKYDEYAWQKEKGILVKDINRAKGLEKVLYKCPHCYQEFTMRSDKFDIFCNSCHKKYRFNEDGSLEAYDGKTEFSHMPDWYEWERECVKQEIIEGKYHIEDNVDVDSLPNSKGFINMGEGHFIHDINGLKVIFTENGRTKEFIKTIPENYSCHIEFDYNNKGDAVSFSKDKDTYYFYFNNLRNVIVKIHFGVEELFKLQKKND